MSKNNSSSQQQLAVEIMEQAHRYYPNLRTTKQRILILTFVFAGLVLLDRLGSLLLLQLSPWAVLLSLFMPSLIISCLCLGVGSMRWVGALDGLYTIFQVLRILSGWQLLNAVGQTFVVLALFNAVYLLGLSVYLLLAPSAKEYYEAMADVQREYRRRSRELR